MAVLGPESFRGGCSFGIGLSDSPVITYTVVCWIVRSGQAGLLCFVEFGCQAILFVRNRAK